MEGCISYDKKEYNLEHKKLYRQSPEGIAREKAYRQENKERLSLMMKEYRQRPEWKEQRKQYDKKYDLIKKAETQGEGTLEAFLK